MERDKYHELAFKEWLNDLLMQRELTTAQYLDILADIESGKYDEILSKSGGVY